MGAHGRYVFGSNALGTGQVGGGGQSTRLGCAARGLTHTVSPTVLISALGHVWTAPWQELSDVAAALVGCGHVSGLFVRPGMAAGPNALRGSGPNRFHALEGAMTQTGSPDPRNDRVCVTSSCPRQFLQNFSSISSLPLPSSGLTSLNCSCFSATTL